MLAQVQAQRARVRSRLAAVSRVVGVMSGKGGVGKSYVTSGLAIAAQQTRGWTVGVLDADLHGPTVARLLDATGPVRVKGDVVHPAVGRSGIAVFSMDLLLADEAPLRWRDTSAEHAVSRGLLEAGALREFLGDVAWGELDLLLVDLPPGTASLTDLAGLTSHLTGVLAITIPSEESRRAVARALTAAASSGVRVLGIVENMSEYVCGECGARQELFSGQAGSRLAESTGAPLIGRIPFFPGLPDQRAESRPVPPLPEDVVARFFEVIER